MSNLAEAFAAARERIAELEAEVRALREAAQDYLRHAGDVFAIRLATLVGLDPQIALDAARRTG